MGTQGTGRKRSTKKERSNAEDEALNLIAREAEARLAAKRAARAEAREIRMKELERQQKEEEEREYLEKGSRAPSVLTAGTLTSLGGTSLRRGSGDTTLTVDAESSIREIKEALAEAEDKYRKTMVSNAQLDNDKNNLMYQVDALKDSLMELEEQLSESQRQYEEKVKECEREKHAHSVLLFQFNEMKETLKQSEELLNKHGIILGPDLNLNGDVGEAEPDKTSASDPTSHPAQDSNAPPPEGNSMLGNTEENELRGCREEEVDPEQLQAMLDRDKDIHVNSDTHCVVTDTCGENQIPEEEETCLSHKEDSSGDSGLSKDLTVDGTVCPTTETNALTISPDLQGIQKDCVDSAPQAEMLSEVCSELVDTQSCNVGIHGHNMRENILEERENRHEDLEQRSWGNAESCQVILPDQSVVSASNTESEQNPNNAEDKDEEEEIPSKSQAPASSGKKKKKKRKGKKKGGVQDNENQQKAGPVKENRQTEKDLPSKVTECATDGSVTESLKSKSHQIKDQQEPEKEQVENTVEPAENRSHKEAHQEPSMTHASNEHEKERNVDTKMLKNMETVVSTETLNVIGVDRVQDEQNNEEVMERENTKSVDAEEPSENVFQPLSESTTTDSSMNKQEETTDSTTNKQEKTDSTLNKQEKTDSTLNKQEKTDPTTNKQDDSQTVETQKVEAEGGSSCPDSESVDEMKSEHTTNNEKCCKEHAGVESNVPDAAAKKLKSTNDTERKDGISDLLTSTDNPTDAAETLKTSDGFEGPEEAAETEGLSPHRHNNMEAEQNGSGMEKLTGDTREPGVVSGLDQPLHQSGGDYGADTADSQEGMENTAIHHMDLSASNTETEAEENAGTCPEAPQMELHKSSKDDFEGSDSSQNIQLDNNGEEEEEEEGQSFDFDDMDVETSQESSHSVSPKEEFKGGAEVVTHEIICGDSELTPNQTEPKQDSHDKRAENNDRVMDEADLVGELGGEQDAAPHQNQDSLLREEVETGKSDEPKHISVPGKVISAGDPVVVADDVKKTGLGEGSALPKAAEQLVNTRAVTQAEKDAKKSKKAKGKGKEDCKMS